MAIYVLSDGGPNIVKFPYSIGELRRDNPSVSFPASPSDEFLSLWNMFPVTLEEEPSYDVLTQSIEISAPVSTDGGLTWSRSWTIVNLDATQQAENLAQLEEAAADEAGNRLDIVDQYVVSALARGQGLSTEFEAYRASLLDYTSLTGYPADVIWPTIPETIFTDTPGALPIDAYTKAETDAAISAAASGPAAYGWVQDRFVGDNNKVSGCTAALTASGEFTITLDTPFATADDYIVMATGIAAHQYVIVDQRSGSSFRIRATDTGGGTIAQGFCQFVVHSLV